MVRKKDKQFYFKQFSVRHDRSGMKVGTDGVLLATWAEVTNATHILDIGTGTGVIALILAQRTQSSTKIEAIEIDDHASEDASENLSSSPWKNRLTLHQGSVQDFSSSKKFDFIISNPPYFIGSFKPPDLKRVTARHTESLSFHEILDATEKLLSDHGTFNVILPYKEGIQFIALATKKNLHCSRKWTFRARKEKPVERLLLEFSRKLVKPETGEILLYNEGEEWSDDYKMLTRDFYLKL